MPRRRSTIPRKWGGRRYAKPPHPIAPGKMRTSGRRLIYRSGGGQYHLDIWKSLGKPRRQRLRRVYTKGKGRGRAGGLSRVMRNIGKRRTKKGLNPRTGRTRTTPTQPIQDTGPKQPDTTFTYPHQRNVPVRLRGFRGNNLR